MADVFSKEKRSVIMRQVKGHGNKSTELRLKEIFRRYSIIGWRRNSNLFGRPDFTFPSLRIVVFVDGCFWHGHDCRNTSPADNKDYWTQKILRNQLRDKTVNKLLRSKGWKVIRIWECQLREKKKVSRKLLILKNSANFK